jgi:hypothetical protein
MYSPLGQQAPLLRKVNPDGSVTYYFGTVEAATQVFPDAVTADVIPEAERQAVEAQARAVASGGVPRWVVPVVMAVGLFLVVRRVL